MIGWKIRCDVSTAPDHAPSHTPKAWLARPKPSADMAAAPATGCARRLTALAISFGIILVRSRFIFSSSSNLGIKGFEYGAIEISWSFLRLAPPRHVSPGL